MTSKEQDLVFSRLLVEAWAEKSKSEGQLEHSVPGTTMRHSMAGKCSKMVDYYLRLGYDGVTNPFDLPGYWSTGLGTAVHKWWQEALADLFPDAELEKTIHIPEADSSGHADAWLPESKTMIELKSINGYGFKLMAEGGQPPRYEHVMQLALNAYGLKAETAVLVYLSLEAVSKNRAKSKGLNEIERIAKEYHYTADFFMPLAEKEIERLRAIREAGEATPRAIPDPELPRGNRIVNPSNGMWKKENNSGYYWGCSYCAYQDRCAADLLASTPVLDEQGAEV